MHQDRSHQTEALSEGSKYARPTPSECHTVVGHVRRTVEDTTLSSISTQFVRQDRLPPFQAQNDTSWTAHTQHLQQSEDHGSEQRQLRHVTSLEPATSINKEEDVHPRPMDPPTPGTPPLCMRCSTLFCDMALLGGSGDETHRSRRLRASKDNWITTLSFVQHVKPLVALSEAGSQLATARVDWDDNSDLDTAM